MELRLQSRDSQNAIYWLHGWKTDKKRLNASFYLPIFEYEWYKWYSWISFLHFDELIEKLEKKNLIIIDRPNLIYYFKPFNYQRVINEYNKPFLINLIDRKYLQNANSQMIIDFFNFDRFLSVLITSDLHSIGMKLSSSIVI